MAQDLNFSSSSKRGPLWALFSALALATLLPIVLGTHLSWHSLGELDVWLHQDVGQRILNGEGFPRQNTYSFTEPDQPWTNHEWLFQILVSATGPGPDDLPSGIERWVVFRSGLSLLLLLILLLGDKPWKRTPLQLIWLAPGFLLGVSLIWTRLLLRPELFSYVFLILVIRLAEAPAGSFRTPAPLSRWLNRESLAFLVTMLWAQFHGFSALAPVLWLLGGALGYIPGSNLPKLSFKQIALGTGALILALMLTPNGWHGVVYPLQALSQFSGDQVDIQASISELQPLLESSNGLHLTILAFKISLVWGLLLVLLSWRKLSFLRILFWLLAAVATLFAQRNIGFYAVAFTLLHSGWQGFGPLTISWFNIPHGKKRILSALPVVFSLIMASWFLTSVMNDRFYLAEGQSRRFGTGPTVARFPFEATKHLSLSPGTRVFANVDAASLSLSQGKAQVFIDGRTEAYSGSTWSKYQSIRQAGPDALNILDTARTQKILLSTGGGAFHPLLRRLLQTPNWVVSYADPAGVLFSRKDSSPPQDGMQTLARFARLKPAPTRGGFSVTKRADQWAARASLAELSGLQEIQETYLRKGLALCSHHPRINFNLGNLLMNKNMLHQALEHFEKAYQTNPRLGGAFLNAGVCQMNLGNFEEATKMFAKAKRLQPGNFQAWANHSLALQRIGRHNEALESLTEAVRLAPNNVRLKQALDNLRSHR